MLQPLIGRTKGVAATLTSPQGNQILCQMNECIPKFAKDAVENSEKEIEANTVKKSKK